MTVSITNYYNLRTSNFKANDVADAIDGVQGVNFGGTTGGTSTAYTATPTPAWTSYAAKDWIVIVPHTTNTGATTLNVSSLGTKNVYYLNAACTGGELLSGVPAMLYYDGTQFQIVTPGDRTWQTWTPTYGAGGSMTYTSVATTRGRYRKDGNIVIFHLESTGTTGGSADNRLTFTLPIGMSYVGSIFAAAVTDGGTTVQAYGEVTSVGPPTVVTVKKADVSNFGLSSGRIIRCTGVYEF